MNSAIANQDPLGRKVKTPWENGLPEEPDHQPAPVRSVAEKSFVGD
jgi:hypothetical protein